MHLLFPNAFLNWGRFIFSVCGRSGEERRLPRSEEDNLQLILQQGTSPGHKLLSDWPHVSSGPPRLTLHCAQGQGRGALLGHPHHACSICSSIFFFLLFFTILGKLVSRIQIARRKLRGHPIRFLPQITSPQVL